MGWGWKMKEQAYFRNSVKDDFYYSPKQYAFPEFLTSPPLTLLQNQKSEQLPSKFYKAENTQQVF